jgi:hypothetical protein
VLTGKPGLDVDVLRYLPYAVDASFNSYAKHDPSTCLPNTRVSLLQEIYNWVDSEDERCIFWLNGLAGSGKSIIARTVARRYFEQQRLGASFSSQEVEETLAMPVNSSQVLLCSLRITRHHFNDTFWKLLKSRLILRTILSVTSGASSSSVHYQG